MVHVKLYCINKGGRNSVIIYNTQYMKTMCSVTIPSSSVSLRWVGCLLLFVTKSRHMCSSVRDRACAWECAGDPTPVKCRLFQPSSLANAGTN